MLPEAPLRAVPSGGTSLHMGFHRRFPRRGAKWSHVTAELIRPLSPPALPGAGDGPAGLGHAGQALHAAELAAGSCLGFAGCFRVLC